VDLSAFALIRSLYRRDPEQTGRVLYLNVDGLTNLAIAEGKRPTFFRVASTSFLVILVAEFGDLTQLVTANLAAKYHDPLTVGLGAVLGLWAVAALAIAGGRSLLKVIPISVITRVAAGIMAVLATISIVSAIRG